MTSVTRTVFAHEWAAIRRRGALMLMALITGIVGLTATILEHSAWRAETAERVALQEQELAQWLGLGDVLMHKAAHRGFFVIRDLPPGAILDRGVWDYGGTAIWLEAHKRNAAQLRAADAQALLARGAPRGVGPILLWLVPLLMAVLLHGVVAQERASGSLAFAVSSGAPPGAIIAGKALAVIAAGWAAAALPLIAGLGLSIWAGLDALDGLLWSLSVLAALAVFGAVVTSVSATVARPLSALVTLLLIWFLAATLWPRLAAEIADAAAPIPSSQILRSAADAEVESLDSSGMEPAVLAELLAEGLEDPNPSAVSLIAYEVGAAEIYQEAFEPLAGGMERQAHMLDLLSWASPLAAADRQADAWLGLGDRDHLAFEAHAETMRFETQMMLNRAYAAAEPPARGGETLWREVIEAAEAVPPVSPARSIAGLGLALWLAIGVGLLFAARFAVRKDGQ